MIWCVAATDGSLSGSSAGMRHGLEGTERTGFAPPTLINDEAADASEPSGFGVIDLTETGGPRLPKMSKMGGDG